MNGGSKCNSGLVGEESIFFIINRMISDNYSLIFLFIFLSIIIALIFVYFAKELKNILKIYYDAQGGKKEAKEKPVDDELYDDEDPDPYIINQHMDIATDGFFKNVETKYTDYNTEKTNYIINNYKKETSDDVIDRNMLFSKNDDYTYDKKPETL